MARSGQQLALDALVVTALLLTSGEGLAQPSGQRSGQPSGQPSAAGSGNPPAAPPAEQPKSDAPIDVFASGTRSDRSNKSGGRAGSKVDRREIEEQLPRSTPDALRYEPGVYVQQTAHAQASPYVRGRTGQQTLLLFDGIRLNNSTFRQGPNQYFFTVDAQTVHSIDVLRGGSSTLYGSDAIGGVIEARPMEPRIALGKGLRFWPRLSMRATTADGELGFRTQLDAQINDKLRMRIGGGSRRVGQLESAGAVLSPETGQPPEVPAFLPDGRTQLGTGFREMTADGRLVYGLGAGRRLVAATYLYRQFDAPRTDKCPPPFAPINECLRYEEQFRTLAYLAYQGDLGAAARKAHLTLSFQRQHERRRHERPAAFVVNGGRDDVDTFGVSAKLMLPVLKLGGVLPLQLTYGGDAYFDRIDSAAWTQFTDVEATTLASRGQYLSGSTYVQGGAFVDAKVALGKHLVVRAGARGGGARADSPTDPESATLAVHQSWPALVGHLGLTVRPIKQLTLLLNADRSFRAPTLEALSSRQQTGPGFQFENPALTPETAISLEAGLRLDTTFVEADLWAYRSTVRDAIVRTLRGQEDCPAALPQCLASWSRFQLVNLPADAIISGLEGSARLRLPLGFSLRATVAYAHGEGPNPEPRPDSASDSATPYEETVPLSRIPPLNGAVETRWQSPHGPYLGGALRWATLQDRLAPSDRSDARIPLGGTPGFAVVDLRAGYRFERQLLLSLVVENLADSVYRYHGSSVNGPGRGIVVHLEGGL